MGRSVSTSICIVYTLYILRCQILTMATMPGGKLSAPFGRAYARWAVRRRGTNQAQAAVCEDSLTQSWWSHLGVSDCKCATVTVRGFAHTTTAEWDRMTAPNIVKRHRVRIHSHTAGSGGTDRNTERCKGALCEDPLTQRRSSSPRPRFQALPRGVV